MLWTTPLKEVCQLLAWVVIGAVVHSAAIMPTRCQHQWLLKFLHVLGTTRGFAGNSADIHNNGQKSKCCCQRRTVFSHIKKRLVIWLGDNQIDCDINFETVLTKKYSIAIASRDLLLWVRFVGRINTHVVYCLKISFWSNNNVEFQCLKVNFVVSWKILSLQNHISKFR